MSLKKRTFSDNEIAIYDDAVIYMRGEYWQFRMWLNKEGKYARFSLRTRSRSTAEDKAKHYYHTIKAEELAGRRYYSLTTKAGVEKYLEQRLKDVEAGGIVKGRYKTIETHLTHWLDFIGRDTKLKELERTDCENYFHSRTKTKKDKVIRVSQTTVENEQSTVNAMISWLYKRKETNIDGFDFKKLPRIDRGDEAIRRSTFTDAEVEKLFNVLDDYIKEAECDLAEDGNLTKAVCGYYLGVSLITGLRRGEQLQLRWSDIEDIEHTVARKKEFDLIKITVRGETSKVKKTRKLIVRDYRYFSGMLNITIKLLDGKVAEYDAKRELADRLIFTVNGKNAITARAIGYHFDKLIELAKIKTEGRDLVPYSFRHYFITKRVNSNLPPATVAEMCGTSITQIEKTYYHTTFEKMVSNALADYEIRDGLIVIK